MNLLGNLIWLIFGGFISAMAYVFGGFVLCITIIGIPFGLQCFKLAGFVAWPFGSKVVYANNGGGCLQTIGNIIWLFSGGWCAALSHFVFGCLLFITIIGIPFARKHFQLIELSMLPFGKKIVSA